MNLSPVTFSAQRFAAFAANDNGPERRGYVLVMWTGLFPKDDAGLPVLFPTVGSALLYVSRCPPWGRHTVDVYEATVRPDGEGGRPDYILGAVVASGLDAPAGRAHR